MVIFAKNTIKQNPRTPQGTQADVRESLKTKFGPLSRAFGRSVRFFRFVAHKPAQLRIAAKPGKIPHGPGQTGRVPPRKLGDSPTMLKKPKIKSLLRL